MAPIKSTTYARSTRGITAKSRFAATGIKEIVEAAQVPKGSFYNHFPSKEAFGAEVVDFYFGLGLPGLRKLLTDPTVPPLERLRAYFASRTQRFKAAGYARGCMLGNFSLEVADQSDVIRARLSTHFQTWAGLFEHCIAQAQAAGAIRNPLPADLLAGYLLDSWKAHCCACAPRRPLCRWSDSQR